MTKFEKCRWCNGCGDDGCGYGTCPDCEGTGLKGGHSAYEAMEKAIEEDYQKHIDSNKK